MRLSRIYFSTILFCLAFPSNGLTESPPGLRENVNLSRDYDLESPIETWQIEGSTPPKPLAHDGFTDLKRTHASKAKNLDASGLVIGKYIGRKTPSDKEVFWLIANGVPNANQHVQAKILLLNRGDDKNGRWWLLVTQDDYWTNLHNRDTYDFAIHFHRDGTIRLMNPKFVGNPKNFKTFLKNLLS